MWVFLGRRNVWRLRGLICAESVFTAAICLSVLGFLVSEGWRVMIYASIFVSVNLFSRMRGFASDRSFMLAVFATYGVSELYELPYHRLFWFANWFQFGVGLLYSVWGLGSAVLFFWCLWGWGWRPSRVFGLSLVFVAVLFLFVAPPFDSLDRGIALQAYRVPWLLVFLSALFYVKS